MRALLVTHRPPHHPGGAAARWRSLLPALRDRGWQVEVAASDTVDDLAAVGSSGARSVQRRARRISAVKGLARLPFAVARIEVPPRSTAWLPRGAAVVRRQLRAEPDVVIATGPPMVALLAARLALRGRDVPFIVELRDLWAGNPVYDRGGHLLPRLEHWIFARAHSVVVCTPEALADVRARHPDLADRCVLIPNGFEHVLLEQRAATPRTRPLVLLHSGVLTPQRPLAPILEVLGEAPYAGAVRLVLHGFLAPELEREVAAAPPGVEVEVIAPSDWQDATRRIAAAGATLVTQSRAAGDDTAVASKVYEYLALGKPVLCVTDGGATEALLRRLGADRFCARLDDPASIRIAIDRLLVEDAPPPPASALAPYSRDRVADATAELLAVAARTVANVPAMDAVQEKAEVRAYWENEPCGSVWGEVEAGTAEYYAQIEQQRYAAEPFIGEYADFAGSAGLELLEIGTGMGTDFVQFVRAGARATGIDLTQASIDNVGRRLALEGREAVELRRADSESLPFPDASFDKVYSWGVLHHTPRTDVAIREAIRVLRPGGLLCIMLYHRHSWVVFGHWAKFALLRGRPWHSLRHVVRHRVESIGTKAYSRRELRELFPGVEDLTIDIVPTVYDERFAKGLARITPQLGWNAVMRGRKPA